MEKIKYCQKYKMLVNDRLNELCIKYNVSDTLTEAMLYSLNAGGKRIRPMIVLSIIHDHFGKFIDEKEIIDLACSLEFVHTYSLIHDDLPAMDNSNYRRGKLTNHKVFGDGIAILAGDALLTESFNIISHLEIADKVKLNCIQTLSSLVGANGMVGGQALDINNTNIRSVEYLENINYHKTHDLLLASFLFGAYYINLESNKINQLRTCAKYFGLAFQIKDDLNDIMSTTELTGKDENKDQNNNKTTYPNIYGIKESNDLCSEYLEKSLDIARSIFGNGMLCELIKNTLE